jgi:hypothetical protein
MKAIMVFHRYEEFCKRECPDRAVRCAVKCVLCRLLGILLRGVDRNRLKSLNVLDADYLAMRMLKPGYTCITVPVHLYNTLKSEDSRAGCSIPELIRQKLGTSTN